MNNINSEEVNIEEIKDLENAVKKYPDFPKKGILFYDIFSIHRDPSLNLKLFENSVRKIRSDCMKKNIEFNTIIGLESRGFIVGIMLANLFNVSFVPIRKKNKLPGIKASAVYTTEYSCDEMEIQKDSISCDSKVLIVDDLLATGGTMKVAEKLVSECGGVIASYFVVFEIKFLNGRNCLTQPSNLISLMDI